MQEIRWPMIDKFALLVPHFLLVVAAWRLFLRDDLDREPEHEPGPRVRTRPTQEADRAA